MLPKVLALVNAFKDDEFIADAKKKSTISSSPRTDAAVKLLQMLKGRRELRDIIAQMERMFEGKLFSTKLKKLLKKSQDFKNFFFVFHQFSFDWQTQI